LLDVVYVVVDLHAPLPATDDVDLLLLLVLVPERRAEVGARRS